MSEHTKGRIEFVGGKTPHLISDTPLSGDMADLYHKTENGNIFVKQNAVANGKRLEDCWNACEGMKNPPADIKALREENERLREALGVIERQFIQHNTDRSDPWAQEALDLARRALAEKA